MIDGIEIIIQGRLNTLILVKSWIFVMRIDVLISKPIVFPGIDSTLMECSKNSLFNVFAIWITI